MSVRAFFLKYLLKGKVQKTNTIADQVNFVAKIIAGNYAAIHTSRQTLILGRFSSWKFQEKKLIEKVGHSCLLLLKKTVSEGNLRQFNVIYSRYSPRAGYELIAESVFTEPFSSGDEDLYNLHHWDLYFLLQKMILKAILKFAGNKKL